MSGNHCTRAANGHVSVDSSFSLPSANRKTDDFTAPTDVPTVAAIIFPSGDHDGPVKKIGDKRCGVLLHNQIALTSCHRRFAITSALSPGFG